MWGQNSLSIPGFRAAERPFDLQQRFEKRLRAAERLVARGRLKAGARQALQIVADQKADLACLNRAGDLLVRARRVDRAVAVFERVARAYADDGFWAKAIAIYRKILRCDSGRRDVEAVLTFLYQRSGLPVEVRQEIPVPVSGLAWRAV